MKTELSPGLLTECRLVGQRLAEAVKLPLLRHALETVSEQPLATPDCL